jgi:glycosyltransferase involved in cell wall biosynthesis
MTRDVIAVWNELTPYRLHIMRRLRDELRDVRTCHVFTHSLGGLSSPWAVERDPTLDIVYHEDLRIPRLEQFFHRQWRRLAARILDLVDERKPAFVLMAGHNDLTRIALFRALRRRGIAIAHSCDANIFSRRGTMSPRRALSNAYTRYFLGQASAFMPLGGTAGRAYYSYYGGVEKPTFLFPYEPDYEMLRSCEEGAASGFRTEFGIQAEWRCFLYSGRLVPEKRVDVLIRAFIATADRLPGWHLIIAGRGPEEAALKAMVPAALAHRVRFLGFLQFDRLRIAYHACDVLVHPSAHEPWGLIINEALASGMPIIATNVTGAAIDLVRDRVNGLLVRPGSVEELAQAMMLMSDDETRRRFAARTRSVLDDWRASADPVDGFRRAVDHFSGERRSDAHAGGHRLTA